MAPSESSILNDFLLQPAPLPAILSLQTFTDLIPEGQQNNVQIKSLYRNLKSERAFGLEQIKHNIDQECKRGERQMRQVIKARRQAEKSVIKGANIMGNDVDDEVEIHTKPVVSEWYGSKFHRSPIQKPVFLGRTVCIHFQAYCQK